MPHDSKGKLIANGDIVKVRVMNQQLKEGQKVVGTVSKLVESESCSGQLIFMVPGGTREDYFNASDCELVLKADGTEPA